MIGPRRALLVALLTLASLSTAAGQQATYKYEVPSGQFKRVRIVNVSEGTVLAVLVKLAVQIDVLVLYGAAGDKTEKDDAAPVASRPLVRVQAVKQLSFSVRTPVAGQYYVVLDNRKGTEPQAVEMTIAAQRRDASPKKKPEEPPAFPRS